MVLPIRVLVCDDHQLFRRGLRMVLEAEEGIEVVAEAADGEAALAEVENRAPDVVLMDLRMPGMGGMEATRAIRQRFPTTRIIVLTVSDEDDDVFAAMKAGANGYLLKEVSIEEVAEAVRAVMEGNSLLSPSLASRLLTEMGAAELSENEQGVLRWTARGESNVTVADRLGIPNSAVRNHLGNVLIKLQQRSSTESST